MLTTLAYDLAALGAVLLCTARTSFAVSDSRRLISRQTSTFDPSQIPSACQSSCNSIVDNANTCTTFQCLCTPKNDAAVQSCVNCVISLNHTGPVIIDGQDSSIFASECNLNNVSVSSLSASGVATVTGITTSNFNPPPTSTSASQSASPPSFASTIHLGAQFLIWSSYAAVTILVTLTMT
ncbi:hypothetical protein B0H17DRAFT_1110501 [Mycena rosella]|uniref:Extracellular membrane protein CFEM domain-containing protein n=1 Tax=Mycena rosella TaxID=1033263 RepID=A0AAD7BPU4_MYCRO|nr:hypothetical protein B0H17DRAFT_1110501 [Mycena rosella]